MQNETCFYRHSSILTQLPSPSSIVVSLAVSGVAFVCAFGAVTLPRARVNGGAGRFERGLISRSSVECAVSVFVSKNKTMWNWLILLYSTAWLPLCIYFLFTSHSNAISIQVWKCSTGLLCDPTLHWSANIGNIEYDFQSFVIPFKYTSSFRTTAHIVLFIQQQWYTKENIMNDVKGKWMDSDASSQVLCSKCSAVQNVRSPLHYVYIIYNHCLYHKALNVRVKSGVQGR